MTDPIEIDPAIVAAAAKAYLAVDEMWLEKGVSFKRILAALQAAAPLLIAGERGALECAQKSILAASIGSCDCHTKTPDPAFHMGYCRYLKLQSALEQIAAAIRQRGKP